MLEAVNLYFGVDFFLRKQYNNNRMSKVEDNNMLKIFGDKKKAQEEKIVLQNMRVLLAEDNELNAELAKTILEMKGIMVDVVENGVQAVEAFEKSKEGYYSTILMDIRMPVMDGLEATRKIRKLSKKDAKIIPIIAVTVNTRKEDIELSLAAGMNAHLPKPIDPNQMYEVLEQYKREM